MFIVGLAGISIGLWPFVVRGQVAASSRHPGTQPEWYSGIDILIIMLIAFASQLLAYWLSRGKTPLDSTGYEQHRAIQGRRTASQGSGLHLS